MIKGILFDMDGTIVDTEPLHFMAVQQVLADIKIKMADVEFSHYVGLSEEMIFKKVKSEYGIKYSFELFEKKRRINFFALLGSIKPTAGLIEFLKLLNAEGIAIGLVTSSGREVADEVLSKLGISAYFSVIISADDVQNKKPDSEPYLLSLRRLGLDAEDCIAVEDSTHGIESAKSAGLRCIGITTYHSEAELKKADLIIKDFEGIDLKLIDGK